MLPFIDSYSRSRGLEEPLRVAQWESLRAQSEGLEMAVTPDDHLKLKAKVWYAGWDGVC